MTKSKKAKPQDKHKQPILVIDGRPIRKFYTSIFLQRCNYLVITADNAEDGLRYMNVTKPLVVIANIDLPDMNGAELLKRVKKSSKTRSVPVIIYTSNKDLQIQEECEQAGCSAYLRHPASLEELYTAIQKATNKPRRFVRLETLLDVSVGDGQGAAEQQKHSIAVLSELGMFVSTASRFSYGSIHPFTFHLPNAPGWPIKTEGQIVYHQESTDRQQTGIGVKFLKMGNQEREFIKNFIREKLMEGVNPLAAARPQ
jgi:CheY-like chemotaxis protein/Tfp pilus assembly protein PilZ